MWAMLVRHEAKPAKMFQLLAKTKTKTCELLSDTSHVLVYCVTCKCPVEE